MITILLIMANISTYLVFSYSYTSKFHYLMKEYSINNSHIPMVTNMDYYTLFSSMFIHSNITHIVMNMIALFQFGSLIERNFSIKLLLSLYFSAGLVGSLFSVFYIDYFNLNIMVIGASGAIFGLIAFHGIINYGLFAVIGEFIVFHVLVYVLRLPIAWYAHLGGAIVGILFAYTIILKRRLSSN